MKLLYIFALLAPVSLIAQCEPGVATYVTEDDNLKFNTRADGTVFSAAGGDFAFGCEQEDAFKPLIYSMAHWIGGISPDQQLKLAAETYAVSGNDFWPGPLTTDGAAEVASGTCLEYDKMVYLRRSWTEQHRAYFDCLNDPECDEALLFLGGYEIPQAFYDYPAMGDVEAGQAATLLPYVDYDEDGSYDPAAGDYPMFGDSDDCCNSLQGDECVVWIMNDKGNVHSSSQGEPIGIEQHHIVYRYYSEDLANAVFHATRYFNRGTNTLSDTYLSAFIDADIGNYNDDYAAFIPEENTALVFNGDFNDEGFNGFGAEAPGLAIRMLRSPLQDPNEVDDDGDGIVDNEQIGLVHGLYSDPFAPSPGIASDYYNWMRGFYVNGQVFQDEGEDADFQNEGLPQGGELFQPTDTRLVMSSGPFTLTPGLAFCTTEVVCWDFPEPGEGPVDAAERALAFSGEIQEIHDACYACVSPGINITFEQVGNVIQFINLGAGDDYLWEFSDGSTSIEVYPQIEWTGSETLSVTVTVSNECGSVTETFEIETSTTVNEQASNHLLEVYPVPAVATLQVEVHAALKAPMAQIHTAAGQLVASPRLQPGKNQIDISPLPKGAYLLTVQTADGQLLNQRFIK
jgi:hypothetical protein